jgi:hypothetical protein
MRAFVLIVCLVAAGTIVGLAHYTAEPSDERTAVFVVPQRTEPPLRPSAPPPAVVDIPTDKVSLTRALQRELKRVGCYSGEITGVWTTSSRMAMKSFVDRANAALPIDNPDAVLLSLVRNHQGQACATDCPPGQAASGGACPPPAPPATLARATDDPALAGTKDGPPAALPATAAAGLAAAAVARPADERRPVTEARTPAVSTPDPAPSEKAHPSSPETKPVNKMRDRRARRQKTPQPPKIIRDFLRTVERTFRPR